MFAEFINTYAADLLRAALVAIAGWLGTELKKLYEKKVNTKIKQDLAKTVVQFVEQVYKDLHGEEKLNVALSSFSELLMDKGIHVSEIEMRIQLEAALAEFNGAFTQGIAIDPATDIMD